MNTESNILAECFVDTLIVKTILYPKKDYNHKKGCTQVIKQMKDKFENQAALGIIDDDKSEPKDFESFALLKRHNEQLSIYKYTDKPHYIVKIGKAAEDFILKNAEKCNVSLSEYDLPSDLNGLRKITKHIKSMKEADAKLKKVFSTLNQNKISDFFKLAQWIEVFKTNPYNITIELL